MRKRVIGLLCCFMLCLSLVPTSIFAADIASGTGWNLDDTGCLYITGDVTNPSTGDTDNTPWKSNKSSIKSVVVTSGASVDSCRSLFSKCTNLVSADLEGLDTSAVTDMYHMFYNCSKLEDVNLSGIDTSSVVDMGAMFYKCGLLTELDVSGFNTAQVTNFHSMFNDCSALENLDVSGFETSNATDMGMMFNLCNSLSVIDVGGFTTSKVTDMSHLFDRCYNVTDLDVDGFDTSNVTNMSYMFTECYALTELDVSSFDTSKVTNMCAMFTACRSLTELDVSGFTTSSVTNMVEMFAGNSALTTLDLSGFDTSSVTMMRHMFAGCGKLATLDISSFDISHLTSGTAASSNMFDSCDSLVEINTNESVRDNAADLIMGFAGSWRNKEDRDTAYPDAAALKAASGNVTIIRGYLIDFDANGGSVSPTSAVTGTDGKLTALPTPTKSGRYAFNGWYTSASGGDAVTAGTVFTTDSSIYAAWRSIGGGGSSSVKYMLTFDTNGGSAIKSISDVSGKVISLGNYVPVKEGYTFEGWYTNKNLTGAVSEVKLNDNMTVYAKWSEKETKASVFPFKDVTPIDWSYKDVYYVWEKGLMNGTSDEVFDSQLSTSRAMIATIIWRMEGEPKVNYNMSFGDVPEGMWYTEAICWAQANGIVKGYDDETFGPEDLITREQKAAIIYRYAVFKGYDLSGKSSLSQFTDAGMISDWAIDNVAWANAKGLIKGVTDTEIDPQGLATREQVAAIFHRFCENVAK